MSLCPTACNNEAICVSLVMDIRVSPHRDIEAFKELLDGWISEAGPGCSMRFIHVRNMSNYCIMLYYVKNFNTYTLLGIHMCYPTRQMK